MKIIANQEGFTYIAVLTIVMIMGIMLGLVGQSWKTIKQRELEEEMIFRGNQIVELLYQMMLYKGADSNLAATTNVPLWPIASPKGTILDELVNGKIETFSNKPPKNFRLRASAAIDPMTNKPWKIVSPVGFPTLFKGVASESTAEPFKKNFKTMYDSKLLDEKKQYSDWLFTWELKQTSPQNQNQNLNLNLKR
jgi:type II secretory pathway pseudopilin PulG